MSKYKVKVYMRTGESLSFFTSDLEGVYDPFPNLSQNEYLYYPFDQDGRRIFEKVTDRWDWVAEALMMKRPEIMNFVVVPAYEQRKEFIGLTRSKAQDLAMDQGLSFRVVFENGLPVDIDHIYNDVRVSVYLDDNGIVYLAEIF